MEYLIEDGYLIEKLRRWASMKIKNPPKDVELRLFGLLCGYLKGYDNAGIIEPEDADIK